MTAPPIPSTSHKPSETATKLKTEERLDKISNRWFDSTPAFVEEAIGVGSGTDGMKICQQQRRALEVIDSVVLAKEKRARGEKLTPEEAPLASKIGVIIRSGKGNGKTSLLSWFCHKVISMFDDSKILATAPKQDLLRDNLWGELHRWKKYSEKVYKDNSFLKAKVRVRAESMTRIGQEGNIFMVARTCSRTGTTEDQRGTLQGYHAPYLFDIVDEAWSVPDIVFEPLISSLTGEVNFAILAGNPTKNYGFAHEAYEGKYKDFFVQVQLNGEESELLSDEYKEQQKEFYKDDINGYRVNFLGLPPLDTEKSLIPYSKIMEAVDREIPEQVYRAFPMMAVIDIGAGGDLTVYTPFQGPMVFMPSKNSDSDPTNVGRFVVGEILKTEPEKVGLDGIGVGWGMEAVIKREVPASIEITRIKVSNSAYDKTKFKNLRSQLAWEMRQEFIGGEISIPNHPTLIKELACLELEDTQVDATVIQLKSKHKMISQGALAASPNYADCIIMRRFYTRKLHNMFKSMRAGEPIDSKPVNYRYESNLGNYGYDRRMEEDRSFMSY